MLTRLAVKLLGHELNEVTYPAELAGLAFSASNTLTGFQASGCGRPPDFERQCVGRGRQACARVGRARGGACGRGR